MLKSLFEGDSVIVILVLARNTNRGFTVHATECKITVSCPLLWHVSMGHYSNLSPPQKKKHPDQKNKCPIYPPIFPTTKNETQGLSNLSDNLPAFFVQDFVTGFYFLVDGAPWSGSSCGGFWKVWKLQQNEGGSNNAVDGNTPTT